MTAVPALRWSKGNSITAGGKRSVFGVRFGIFGIPRDMPFTLNLGFKSGGQESVL